MNYDLQRKWFKKSRDRMGRLLASDAPDVIIENEARILVRAASGGNWRAAYNFAMDDICRRWSNLVFELQICWQRVAYGIGRDRAIDKIIGIEEEEV